MPIPSCVHAPYLSTAYPRTIVCLFACLLRQYEKRFEKDDREKDRRKAREAMSDKIHMKLEFRQQVSACLRQLVPKFKVRAKVSCIEFVVFTLNRFFYPTSVHPMSVLIHPR